LRTNLKSYLIQRFRKQLKLQVNPIMIMKSQRVTNKKNTKRREKRNKRMKLKKLSAIIALLRNRTTPVINRNLTPRRDSGRISRVLHLVSLASSVSSRKSRKRKVMKMLLKRNLI
jgi:hypothetical protein